MKTQMLIGTVLIVVGVLILAYQGITYTKRSQILKAGSSETAGERRETFPVLQAVGTLATAGGIFLLVLGSRKS